MYCICIWVELFNLCASTASLCGVTVDIYRVAFTLSTPLGRSSRRLWPGSSILLAGNEQGGAGQSIPPNNRTTYRFTRRGLHEVMSKLERHQASIVALSNTIWLAVNGVFNDATDLASVSSCFFFFFLNITIFHIIWCHIWSCLDHTAPAGASSPSSSSTVSHYQPYVRRH